MPGYFLGVDIGATKSHALIADDQGRIVGVGIAGPGNHESIGVDGFRRTMQQVVGMALEQAGLAPADLSGAGFGIAGYDWDEDTPMIHAVIDSLGMNAPYEAMNDAGPGLLAGAPQGWGVSITAGTSVNGRGRGPDGRMARMTGNGLHFAEVGGGSELVYRAVNSISRAWSLRGPQTRLSDDFVRFAGASSVEDLLAGIARGRYRVGSRVAPLVFAAAAAGDAVALDTVRWLGEGLGDLAGGIIRQLEIEALAFDVVLSGSIFQGSPRIEETMRGIVHAQAPLARFVRLHAPPVSGAILLAMQRAGVESLPLHQTVVTNVQAVFTAAADPEP